MPHQGHYEIIDMGYWLFMFPPEYKKADWEKIKKIVDIYFEEHETQNMSIDDGQPDFQKEIEDLEGPELPAEES